MKRKMTLIIAVLVLAVAGIWGTAGASSTCFSTFPFGSGANLMNFCVSDHGNIPSFESPSFETELIANEGYAVCRIVGTSHITHGFDIGGHDLNDEIEAGFGAPPTAFCTGLGGTSHSGSCVIEPGGANTFPLTIIRDTTDGVFRLKQTFSRDTTEKDVTITMNLKNISAASMANVNLTRYFRNWITIINGHAGRTVDTVWGWNGWGFSLTALTMATPHSTVVQTSDAFSPYGGNFTDGCFDTSLVDANTATGTATNGFAGRVMYKLGTINAGSSKNVKVVYRRY
jgi:hypothetical protein